MLETLCYHMCKPEVSISSGLGTVPGRDRHQDGQTDGQNYTVANTRYSYARA